MRALGSRGGGRYEKLVVLLFMDQTKNVGGAKGCLLSKITKVGGAIAPPAPPFPPPLLSTRFHVLFFTQFVYLAVLDVVNSINICRLAVIHS